MKELPDVPSALLTLALDDLEKAEVDPRYVIDMNHWHQPALRGSRDMLCAVCLAGSVIAFSLGVPPYHPSRPSEHSDENERKLEALDYFRGGSFTDALELLDVNPIKAVTIGAELHARHWEPGYYSADPARFKAQLRAVAADLKERGL